MLSLRGERRQTGRDLYKRSLLLRGLPNSSASGTWVGTLSHRPCSVWSAFPRKGPIFSGPCCPIERGVNTFLLCSPLPHFLPVFPCFQEFYVDFFVVVV